MKKSTLVEFPNLDAWFVAGWATKTPRAKFTIFVPVRDGVEALTFKQSGYVLNTIAEQLAYTDSAQKDLFGITDLQSKTY